jgi:hypothetical protein
MGWYVYTLYNVGSTLIRKVYVASIKFGTQQPDLKTLTPQCLRGVMTGC